MWFREPTPGDLVDVAENMRAGDIREAFALRARAGTLDDRRELAMMLWAFRDRAAWFEVQGLDGSPRAAAFLGVWPTDETGGLLAASMFATPDFPVIARAWIKRVRTVVMPAILARGTRRVECRALRSYRTTRLLIRACGAVEECTLPDYGKSGESFVLYAWRRSDFGEQQCASRRKCLSPRSSTTAIAARPRRRKQP